MHIFTKYLDNIFEPEGYKAGLKRLMLNQIYPAVLGSIVFIAFGAIHAQLVILFNNGIDCFNLYDADTAWRFGILGVTIAFYLTDYYYLNYTRNYGPLFFAFSLVFLLTMFFTVGSLHFNIVGIGDATLELDGKKKVVEVSFLSLPAAFLVFMFLYLIWDIIEFKTARGDERSFYKCVIVWEVLSIVALLFNLFLKSRGLLLATLMVITMFFICITVYKRKFTKLKPLLV